MKLSMESVVVRDQESRWDPDCADEFQFWPRTLWIDPGESTGVTVVWFDPELLLRNDQPVLRSIMAWWKIQLNGNENEQASRVAQIAARIGGPNGLAIGVESFSLRTNVTAQEVLAPVRVTSKIEYVLWRGIKDHDGVIRKRDQIAKQSPSDAKSSMDDERLKRAGMYTPGPDHIRDSTRHSILWLNRLRNEQQRRAGFFRRWYGDEEDWW